MVKYGAYNEGQILASQIRDQIRLYSISYTTRNHCIYLVERKVLIVYNVT